MGRVCLFCKSTNTDMIYKRLSKDREYEGRIHFCFDCGRLCYYEKNIIPSMIGEQFTSEEVQALKELAKKLIGDKK